MTPHEIHIPLFPLPHCVLLPGAVLPLHVFERRYRLMTDHVLEQLPGRRYIATALLVEGDESLSETAAPIHPVVCVGRMLEYSRLPDGRFNILLAGQWRGRVINEDTSRPFRVARIQRMPPQVDSFTREASHLVEALEHALGDATRWGLVDQQLIDWVTKRSDSCRQLVDLLAYYVFPADEADLKQAVLEETDLRGRVQLVLERLEEMVEDAQRSGRTQAPFRPWPPAGGEN